MSDLPDVIRTYRTQLPDQCLGVTPVTPIKRHPLKWGRMATKGLQLPKETFTLTLQASTSFSSSTGQLDWEISRHEGQGQCGPSCCCR